ncbi:MAG: sulfatase-like hydrolase/transferase [Actinobacteria bacterium]|nr:sulfatase-like hydrolase/transferase [Actinomycetota bacterium]
MRLSRLVLLFTVVILVLLVAAGAALAAKPSKVIIITMDQMKPEYVNLYDMTNMKWLQRHGANFKNAIVGQLASETVVSHNTIVSGQFPKHMGWSDEVMRDVDNILGYGPGAIITVGDLTYDQYTAIIDHYDYPKLGDYMKWKYPKATVANFGEKYYQVASTAASSSDWWMTFGGKFNTIADDPLTPENENPLPWDGKYRMPDPSGGVPDYIMNDDRFKVSSGNAWDKYGTDVDKPAWTYSEDGRHVPGPFEEHLSGDAWVVDGAIKLIESGDAWSAMHLNFSGIDKIGHMYGGGPVDNLANFKKYNPASTWIDMVHMEFIAKTADEQIGRLIAALKASGDWKKTLLVVLADHGSEPAKNWYGITDVADMGYDAWYYDPNSQCANTTYGRPGSNNEAVLGPLNADGNLAYSYQSVMIEAWLVNRSVGKRLHTAQVMKKMPGVIATYIRMGNRYEQVWRAPKKKLTASEHKWLSAHAQKLVNTMAWKGASDVIGLLKDKTSYGGAYGDHGGATKGCQRIPMVFYAKGIKHKNHGAQFRLVDVLPTVLRTMGIRQLAPMDGKAYKLPL